MALHEQVEATDVALDEPLVRTSALRLTFASPLYRGATISVFLSALGFSAAAPQIASFLVKDLGASLSAAGLFYLTSLTTPVAGYLIGRRSDRTGRRLGLFRICALLGFAGWVGTAYSTQLWMPYVIGAVIGAFGGAATSQLFAAVHDEQKAHPDPNNDAVVAVVRMALTAGWVIGPVAGTFLAAQTSLHTMLLATAACTLAQILPLGTLRTPATTSAHQTTEPDTRGPSVRDMLPLITFTALYVLVYAGEPIKYAYLPIYMNGQLNFPAELSGAIIGIQPLVEIILMPLAVLVARRIGMTRLMVIGAAFGVAANICFATTGTAAGLFAGQILMGGVWGIFAALGIIVAQRLLPNAVATASAIFLSSTSLASALGGAAGGLGAAAIGLPLVFLIPAALGLLAVIGLTIMTMPS
ncbi:MFS transporter, SET family, sugar efflux transporter [Streptosporangium subroseum]|uniref:MFS transporter, SET family, sugar efflux transporter n=1 Tax=Streptosporangium subroseum TaxID=106412 RepID=A0A239AW04_9ACTN|nr:MFS transporter [Streptosporangium subroseum]SNR99895.1 MFS transporter, SET family, sugar efflux transporter [Streptosporangium subroseum]